MTARIDVDFISRVLAQGFVTEESSYLLDAVQQRLQHLADAVKELELIESKLIQLATPEIQTPTLWATIAASVQAAPCVEETKPVYSFEAVLRDAATGVYGQEVMKTFGKCVFSVYRNATQTEGSNDSQSKLKQVAASANFIVLDGITAEAAEALSDGLPKIFEDVAWSDLPKVPKNYRASNEFAVIIL